MIQPTDREAYIVLRGSSGEEAEDIRAGHWDDTSGMKIIAGHRVAALDAVLRVVEPRAASAKAWRAETDKDDPYWYRFDGAAQDCDAIASSIRALKGEQQ